jgi:hypothetical protein
MLESIKQMAEMITITKKKYDSLMEDSLFLSKLYAAGVDNWGGYGEALEDEEEDEEDDG